MRRIKEQELSLSVSSRARLGGLEQRQKPVGDHWTPRIGEGKRVWGQSGQTWSLSAAVLWALSSPLVSTFASGNHAATQPSRQSHFTARPASTAPMPPPPRDCETMAILMLQSRARIDPEASHLQSRFACVSMYPIQKLSRWRQ